MMLLGKRIRNEEPQTSNMVRLNSAIFQSYLLNVKDHPRAVEFGLLCTSTKLDNSRLHGAPKAFQQQSVMGAFLNIKYLNEEYVTDLFCIIFNSWGAIKLENENFFDAVTSRKLFGCLLDNHAIFGLDGALRKAVSFFRDDDTTTFDRCL